MNTPIYKYVELIKGYCVRLAILCSMTILLGLGGCDVQNIKFRAGVKPIPAALGDFTVGISTEALVEETLGKPFGRGRSMLPFQDKAGDMWCYYYEEGTLEDDRRTFIFIYFDGGIYQGHMWFSSLPDQQAPGS